MKSGGLEAKLRPFETASDRCVPPEVYMVARLDGRGFGKLRRIQLDEIIKPFDVRVRTR
jgi:tRNA(His) guanylyltransferase